MWHDHPFSQRNKSTEGTVGVRFGGDREKGGGGGGGGKIGKRGVFIEKGFGTLSQL